MLKMFQPQVSPGGTPEYWDDSWEADTARVPDDRALENDPLQALFVDKARRDRVFLEGGCGPGHWVRYLHRRGYRVVGVDFAPRAVERLQRLLPDADVRLGDIKRLPFGDGEVHVYFSGGVVEHDESGPEPALREARRVVARDGWFLCSVPDASLLRDLLFFRERTERPRLVVTRVREPRPETPPPGMLFFQYAFDQAEFTEQLQKAGFEVVSHFGYALIWGLMEIPGVTSLVRRALHRDVGGQASDTVEEAVNGERPRSARPGSPRGRELLKRVFVKEDRTMPIVGPAVGWASEHMSNMRMYVARPST